MASQIEKNILLDMKNMKIGDASPTLKEILKAKANQGAFLDAKDQIAKIKRNLNGITLTIGPTSARPVPTNDKNIHINTTDGIPEYYHAGAWQKKIAVFTI